MLLTVVLSLLAALSYGVSDFAGAVGARRLKVLPGTTVTYTFAVVVLVIALPIIGGEWSSDAVVWGAIAGVAAIIGFVAFYAALAAGPISLASPLIAVLGALVPVAIAVALGEQLAPLAWVAVAIALVGGTLISVTKSDPAKRILPRTVMLSVIAGVGLGLSIVALDRAPHESGVIAAVVEIAVGLVLLALLLAAVRLIPALKRGLGILDAEQDEASLPTPRRAFLASAFAGLLLGVANALILAALQSGSLAVVSVLVGLYPIATILLARVLHGERLLPLQLLGVALAIAASVLLAFA
jgi:drug/metabolite transporter (DMT)-like permease